jgi:hypothetical protein
MAGDYRKSITFQAKIDTSDIGPTIDNLKRQFNQAAGASAITQAQMAARMSQQGMGGALAMPKPEDIRKSKQALDQFIREQSQQQEKLYKIIEGQRNKMKELNEIKRDSLKDSKEELRLEERKKAVLEQYIRLDEQYKERDRMLNKALDLSGGRNSATAETNKASLNGADWSGVMPKGGPLNSSKIVGGITTGAGIIAGAAKIADLLSNIPLEIERAKGSAVQSYLGRDVQALQSGAAAFETPWMAERAKAAEIAESKRSRNRIIGTGMGIGGLGLMGAGLATGAAAIGGAPFTLGGSALGLPAAGAMIMGGSAALFNNRTKSAFSSSMLNAEAGQDTLSMWEAMKQQDPKKGAAIDRLQARYLGDLASQRMLGLGNDKFSGSRGFQDTAMNAGFTGDMAIQMAGQIQGSGGSTRGMRGLSTTGLRAERQFDLTNVAGILGRVSGTAGSSERSEQIFRKIMEESIKSGLDKSEFAEEQRRFADATSSILSQSGVRTAQDAAQVLSGFTKFLGGGQPTVRGLEGAKGAYEQSQSFSAETGGRGGALQFAAYMKDPVLKKLGPMGLGAISEMPEKDIHESNPFIISSAREAGISPADLVARIKKGKREKRKSFNPYDQSDVAGLSSSQFGTYQDVQKQISAKYGYRGVEERNSAVMGILGVDQGTTSETASAAYDERMGKDTGRSEDSAVRATAVAAQEMLSNFRNFREVITPASQALREFADAVMAVKTAADSNSNFKDATKRLWNATPTNSLRVQTQAGKPAPGGR